MKPLFSEKVQTSSDITLVENGTLISGDFKVAEIKNDYFVNITETLGISKNAENVSPVIEDTDPVERAIRKYHISMYTLNFLINVNRLLLYIVGIN